MQNLNINVNKLDNLFNSLNREQKDAVCHKEGPILVVAGAGTGKTKVLTCRIANLLSEGVLAHRILAVTFTNKAAAEMRSRIMDIVGHLSSGLWLGTFHSIGAKILRIHGSIIGLDSNFIIINSDEQLKLLKQILQDFKIEEKDINEKDLAHKINMWKDKGLTPQQISTHDKSTIFFKLYEEYQQNLSKMNAVDFGDLLLHNLTIFAKNPEILEYYKSHFQYILVDEYQDTNIGQYLWLRLLASGHKNIFCVGDDDQSIYSWRGAEIANILKFEKDYSNSKIIRLEQNYRSTGNILAAAAKLIATNQSRLGKTLWTKGEEGETIKLIEAYNDIEEANFIANEISALCAQKKSTPGEIAVLVRASFQTRVIEEKLIEHSIPYKIIGGLRFYDRMEIRDCLAYLRLVSHIDDNLSFSRIVNLPKRGIGKTTLQSIHLYGREHNLSYFKATKAMLQDNCYKKNIHNIIDYFVKQIINWQELQHDMSLPEFARLIFEESGYIKMWEESDDKDASTRRENIFELINALDGYKSLQDFLEHVSLVTDKDRESTQDYVSVMTLHAAKGLEFDSVFLAGWEEGIFPHQRVFERMKEGSLEEERRLAYVGLTRAKKRAFISVAMSRYMYGRMIYSLPSRFIDELLTKNVERISFGYYGDYNMQRQASKNVSTNYKKDFLSTESKTKQTNKFKTGERVFHQKFGYGAIISIDDGKISIQFEKSGLKNVMCDYVDKL